MTTTPAGARRSGWFDPWAFAAAAAALLPLLKAIGAPLGEPVADDFDFLHHALFGPRNLLDGGGALIYWRPLARQIYYGALGHWMLTSPLAIALLHIALLAAAAVLIQRALAPAMGGARAAAAATFPVIADSARTLILWPAAMQDLGALFFVALAFHETSRRRPSTALFAALAALLCKELAVVPLLLLPWLPEPPLWKRDRRQWLIAIGVVVVAWAAFYLMVLRSSGLMVQSQLEGARPPVAARLLWALGSSLADGFNLRGVPIMVVGIIGLALAVLALLARVRGWRPTAWLLWGSLWFLLCSATLAETWPVWGSFRSTLGMAGLGIACVAALASRPLVLGGIVAFRLVMLLLAPQAPQMITAAPPGDGSGFDCTTLTRLQWVSFLTHQAIRRMPVGHQQERAWRPQSRFIWFQRPLMSERAFAHSKALQVWLGDTTLAWSPLQEAVDDSTLEIGGGLEYDPESRPQISGDSGEDVRRLVNGIRMMRAERYEETLAELPPAEQWKGGPVLRSIVAGKRALCWLALEKDANASREAEESMRLWGSSDARYVVAVLLASRGKTREAIAELDSLLSLYPEDPSARMLRDTLVADTAR